MRTGKSYTSIAALRAGLAGALLSLGLAAVAQAPANPREEFRVALAAVDRGAVDATADSEALRGYVLYPYLVAARASRRLDTAPDEALDAEVAAFIAAHGDEPAARPLRRRWLMSLAERARWTEFLGQVEDADADADTALRCHRFQAWLQTGGRPGLADEVFRVWLTGEQLPQACVEPFEWLRAQGRLTPQAHEERARLALAADNEELASWLLRAVPAEPAAPLLGWARLLKNPARELPVVLADRKIAVAPQGLLQVWTRYARSQPDVARTLWPRLVASRRLDAAQLADARVALALGLAWNRDPQALEHFRAVDAARLDANAHEWRVRAALWARDWSLAASWLHEMPPALAAEPRWTYWRARALEALGSQQLAAIYRTLAQGNGYVPMLASWRLKQKILPASRPLPADAATLQRLAALPMAQRARELFELGRTDWAGIEWRDLLRAANDDERIQAARLAASWGWYAMAVPTLSPLQLPDDLDLLYPRIYDDVLARASAQSGVPADWLYGVMRQESLFLPGAVSSSQAIGLLQLLVPTARHVALRNKWPVPTREDLMRPELNAQFGAVYLRDILDRFGGRLVPALAGYNAGPNAAARWIPERPIDADVWIENIPFNQTRGYVAKILWNVIVRGARVSGEAQDPAPLLRSVGPSAEVAVAGSGAVSLAR